MPRTVPPADRVSDAVADGVARRRPSAHWLPGANSILRTAAELVAADSEQAVVIARARGLKRLRRSGPSVTPAMSRMVNSLAEQAMQRVMRTARGRTDEEVLDAVVEHSSDVILVLDSANRIRYASPSARRLFGTTMLDDVALLDLIDPPQRRLAEQLLSHARRTSPARDPGSRADLTTRALDGRTAQVEVTCRDLPSDATGQGIVVTLRDVTAQRRLERELTEQASRDPLTGLPNRLSFQEHLSQALAGAVGVTGVLLLNLDQFRAVNEGFGRPTGDNMLIEVGRRLRAAVEDADVVARLGGDEFAVLVPSAAGNSEIADAARRLVEALRPSLSIDGHTVPCGASVGVATSLEASNQEELLRHADLALDAAKAAGRGRWRQYTRSMVHAARIRHEMRAHLTRVLDDGSLIVEYQPIVDLATNRTAGFEALVRCPHPTEGVLAPADFIDIAEESGLIVPIGKHVLTDAIRTARSWTDLVPGDPPYVSVNVSVRQFRSNRFVETVSAALAREALPPERLVLEIVESLLLHDDDSVWEALKRLRDMGIRIAIDDFGTGYSALSYLRQVPLDLVKLDRMFISTMTTSRRQRELVSGIVGLIGTLGLDAVAEGIETAVQRRTCVDIGCRFGQGYLFARPMPASDTLTWLART